MTHEIHTNQPIPLSIEQSGSIYPQVDESLESIVDWEDAYANLENMKLDLYLECVEQIDDLENGTYGGLRLTKDGIQSALAGRQKEIESILGVDSNDRAAVALMWAQYQKRLNQKRDETRRKAA